MGWWKELLLKVQRERRGHYRSIDGRLLEDWEKESVLLPPSKFPRKESSRGRVLVVATPRGADDKDVQEVVKMYQTLGYSARAVNNTPEGREKAGLFWSSDSTIVVFHRGGGFPVDDGVHQWLEGGYGRSLIRMEKADSSKCEGCSSCC